MVLVCVPAREALAHTHQAMSPQQRYDGHIAGLKLAIAEHDWHSVMDHAADLRELIAANPELLRHQDALWLRWKRKRRK